MLFRGATDDDRAAGEFGMLAPREGYKEVRHDQAGHIHRICHYRTNVLQFGEEFKEPQLVRSGRVIRRDSRLHYATLPAYPAGEVSAAGLAGASAARFIVARASASRMSSAMLAAASATSPMIRSAS